MTRRLPICYAAPGHALLSTSGSARIVFVWAAALGQWADVTVAFRSLGEPLTPAGFVLMTIDPPGLGSQRSATTSRSAASILRRTHLHLRDSPPSGLMPSIFRSRRGGACPGCC